MAKLKPNKNGLYAKTVSIPMSDGTTKKIKKYGRSPKEVEEKCNRVKWEHEMGLLTFNSNTMVMRYAEEWLKSTRKDGKTKASEPVYKDYQSRLENHFKPIFAGMRMSEVKKIHCEAVLAQVVGNSQSDIDKTYMLLKGMFRSAFDDEIIVRSPMAKVARPDGTKGKRRSLIEEEQTMFIEAFYSDIEEGNYDSLMFAITFGCGLRPGETRALTVNNVRFGDAPEISVTNAVKKNSQVIGPTKTEAGRRQVPIPDWLRLPLENYIKTLSPSSLLLFPSPKRPNLPLSEQTYIDRWKAFCGKVKNLGADITPYYLRHTYCTNLAEAGVDMKMAQYLMGHESIEMTSNVYTHVTEKMRSRASEKANNLVKVDTEKINKNRQPV